MKIDAGSNHISVTSAQTFVSNCYPPASAQPGQVWYDSGLQELVVFDGSTWVTLVNDHTIFLNAPAENLLTELYENREKVKEIYEKSIEFSVVAEALKQLEFALKLCDNIGDNNEDG